MLLRNFKAVNFLGLREAEVRNLPRRGVVGIEAPESDDLPEFRQLLHYAIFGGPADPTGIIRPGAGFAYVEVELLHREAGAVSIFRGTDRNGTVQASLREPKRGAILNDAAQVEQRIRELLPVSPGQFEAEYFRGAAPPRARAVREIEPAPEAADPPPPSRDEEAADPPPPARDEDAVRMDGRRPASRTPASPAAASGTLLLAVVFSSLAVLLFALLFAARRTLEVGSPWLSTAQVLVGLLVVFNVWMGLREWRRLESPGAPLPESVPAPEVTRPEPEPEPEPAPAPLADDGILPESVREAGAPGSPEDPRFLVLAGRWRGDAEELLRCAGPCISQVFLLTGRGGTPPGSDLRLVVEGAPGGGGRLTAAI
jgi:hypothetical protein